MCICNKLWFSLTFSLSFLCLLRYNGRIGFAILLEHVSGDCRWYRLLYQQAQTILAWMEVIQIQWTRLWHPSFMSFALMHQRRPQVYLPLLSYISRYTGQSRDENYCHRLVIRVMSTSCLHTAGVQCLYCMLCLKRMVCNVRTICYVWNEWCAMFVLHVMLEMNGVQCMYYVLCLKWMVCNACTMYCIHFGIEANVCTCIIHEPWARAKWSTCWVKELTSTIQ